MRQLSGRQQLLRLVSRGRGPVVASESNSQIGYPRMHTAGAGAVIPGAVGLIVLP